MSVLRAARPMGISLVSLALWGCGEAELPPSYLLVEVVPNAGTGAALVTVSDGMTTFGEPVCLRLGIAASFVVSRAPEKDAVAPVTLDASAFDSLSGADGVADGESFPCPQMISVMPLSHQQVRTGFCPGVAKRIAFQLGSTCSTNMCDADQACGAGLDTSANECGFDACCPAEVSDPCALEDAPTTDADG